MGYQICIIEGNLGKAPTLRYLPNGTPVCDFPVAVNESWTTADGEKKEAVTWYKVTCWRKLAELCGQYLDKGRDVLAEGKCSVSAWTAQDGTAKATLELTANKVTFLGGKRDGGESQQEAAPADETDVPF